jgi:hypothetical protein
MLTRITTRGSTPQEDAEPCPGGSARPVLAYLTGTLGMTAAAGSSSPPRITRHRQALTRDRAPRPGTSPAKTGRRAAGKRRTAAGPATPTARPSAGCQPPPRGAAQPGPAEITVTIWHNVAFGGQRRHTATLDGYQPGDPVVRVFAYQARPGRPAEDIAEEAFAIFNDHPGDAAGAELAGLRLLRAQAAVAVVPRNEVELRQVVLRPPERCVVLIVIGIASPA